MTLKLLTASLLTLAAATCTVGPNYKPPHLKLDSSFGPAADPSDTAAWWSALHDSALDKLIAVATNNSLDLKLAEARIRESRAERAVAYSGNAPTVNANTSYEHDRYSQNAAPFNAFNVPNFPWEFNLYQGGFDASWEIDLFGGTRRSIEAANTSFEAARDDRNAVLISLFGEVARNYVELRGYQDQHRIAQRNLDVQNETLSLTQDRMKNGVGTDLDVSRAAAQAAQTAAQLPMYEREEWQAIHRLATLTHQPLQTLLFLRDEAPLPSAPASVIVGVPADLLRRRPDIRAAERRLAAATAQIGVAQADLYPRLSLTGVFNLQSASIDDLFNWRSRQFSFGPAITYPLLDAGRLRAVVDARNAQAEESLVQYEQTVDRAIEEVRDELVSFTTERRRRDSLAIAVKADEESLDLARQLYKQGLTDFLNVLDAQRALYQAQDDLSQSETRVTASFIALYKALGGGWETAPTTMPSPRPATSTAPATRPNDPPKEPVP